MSQRRPSLWIAMAPPDPQSKTVSEAGTPCQFPTGRNDPGREAAAWMMRRRIFVKTKFALLKIAAKAELASPLAKAKTAVAMMRKDIGTTRRFAASAERDTIWK